MGVSAEMKVGPGSGDTVIANPQADKGKLQDGGESGEEGVSMTKNITILHGTCFIVATMIGTGIFVTPNTIAKNVESPGMSIMVWLGGGIIAMISGITFCELGTMFPRNGAEITYLRQAYGALVSFLSCFLLQCVLGGLRRAIQFLSFSEYFWKIFYGDEDPPWILDKIVCIGILFLIIAVITVYPDLTLKVIDVVTVAKLVAVSVVIVLGLVQLIKGNTENLAVGFKDTNWELQKWGDAWNSVMWSYNGWNVACIVLGEVKNPEKLPIIVSLAVGIVTCFYMMAVVSYHAVLDMPTLINGKAIASEVAEMYMGESGVIFFAVAVAVSALGNSMTSSLATSRYLQAGGAQGVLPGVFGLINKRFKTPVISLGYIFLASALFIVVGDLSSLINSATYTSFAFSTLCSIGVLVMRYTKPDHPRPVKVPIICPIISATFGIYMFIIPWFGDNTVMNAVWLAITLVVGIPVYMLCVNKKYRLDVLVRLSDKVTKLVGRLINAEVHVQ